MAHGNAVTDFTGAHFDADGDWFEIANFDYAADGSFAVSFWFTKEECSGGIYEYLYSHNENALADILLPGNSNVNMYIGCADTFGGRTFLRQIMIDSADNGANLFSDYEIHGTGDFDLITARWIHHQVVVDGANSFQVYVDGEPITVDWSTGADTVAPAYVGFNMTEAIHIGARSDHNTDREFAGAIALVQIYAGPISAVQAACNFETQDGMMPAPGATACASVALDVKFVGDAVDRSGHAHQVSVHGAAIVDTDGAHFSGQGDWIEIENFDYYSDETFTIAFWMTKEACTGTIYEYLYSHARDSNADITLTSNSNVNMYIGCEGAGGGWSSAGTGTALRYNLVDAAGAWAMFDFPLHDAGDFDAITNLWIHVVLVVSGTHLSTFDDGLPVSDADYGFYTGGGVQEASNIAYPHPGTLTSSFGAFAMGEAIHLGTRADHNADRHFLGDMAGAWQKPPPAASLAPSKNSAAWLFLPPFCFNAECGDRVDHLDGGPECRPDRLRFPRGRGVPPDNSE